MHKYNDAKTVAKARATLNLDWNLTASEEEASLRECIRDGVEALNVHVASGHSDSEFLLVTSNRVNQAAQQLRDLLSDSIHGGSRHPAD